MVWLGESLGRSRTMAAPSERLGGVLASRCGRGFNNPQLVFYKKASAFLSDSSLMT